MCDEKEWIYLKKDKGGMSKMGYIWKKTGDAEEMRRKVGVKDICQNGHFIIIGWKFPISWHNIGVLEWIYHIWWQFVWFS